jgi:hypothetical protein
MHLARNLLIGGGVAAATGIATYMTSRDMPDPALKERGLPTTAVGLGVLGAGVVGITNGLVFPHSSRFVGRAAALTAVSLIGGLVGYGIGTQVAKATNHQFDPVGYTHRDLTADASKLGTRGPLDTTFSAGGVSAQLGARPSKSLADIRSDYGSWDRMIEDNGGVDYSNPRSLSWDSQVVVRDKDTYWHRYGLEGSDKQADILAAKPADLGTPYAIITMDGQFEPSADRSHFELTVPRHDFIDDTARARIDATEAKHRQA